MQGPAKWKGNALGKKEPQKMTIRRNYLLGNFCPVVVLLAWLKVGQRGYFSGGTWWKALDFNLRL